MSFFAVYVFEEKPDDPEDGDDLATGRGWDHWGDYVLQNSDDYPECAHLAQEGWANDWDDLEHEAEKLTHAPDPDVAAVSARVLAAVKSRPEGCTAVLVTDGTDPGDEDDEDE